MIAIIAALKEELDNYRQSLKDEKTERIAGQDFFVGKLFDKEVVLSLCGVGKVHSAVAATIVIDRYKADYIINTGISGGITAKLLEVVISTAGVQHDVDFSAIGDPLGYIENIGVVIPAGKKLVEAFSAALPDAKKGIIASGDMFVASTERVQFIRDTFSADVVDCESAAILQVAYEAGVEAVALRVMSDNANEKASMSFYELKDKASILAAQAVKEVIQTL